MTTTEQERNVVSAVPTGLFIDGEWREAGGGRTHRRRGPVDRGDNLADVADANVADGKAALDAAVAAQGDWAATPPRDRGEILRRAFELMTERADDLALLMTLEMGKPLAESQGRDRVRGGVLPLVLRGGGAHRRALVDRAERRHPAAHDEAAGRAVPVHHAVELPARDGHPQDRARPSPPAARWWSSRPR